MDAKPDFWNWVTPRSKCSAAVIFDLLYESVEINVRTANDLERSKRAGLSFHLTRMERKFTVVRTQDVAGFQQHSIVVFTLAGETIRVSAREEGALEERELLVATPSFLEMGDCQLETANGRLQPWQVTRLALEPLFFPA